MMNNMEKLDSTQKSKKSDKVELPGTLKKRFAELDHIAEDKDISPRLISALKLLARIEEATNGKIIGSVFEARDVWKLHDPNTSADSAPAKTVKRDLKNLVLVGRLHLIGETCPICGHKTHERRYSLQPFREQYDFADDMAWRTGMAEPKHGSTCQCPSCKKIALARKKAKK
jgi:ribosomal protein L37AE/L43A